MKGSKIALSVIISFLFIAGVPACNSKQNATAHIFERKQTNDNRLMIKYRFTTDNKEFIDSSIIDNTVIANDTITVSFDKNSPENSTAELKK